MTESIQYLSSVEQIMRTQVSAVSADQTVSDIRSSIVESEGEPLPVVDDHGQLIGVINGDDVIMDGPSTARQLAAHPRMTVAPHESAFSVVSRMMSRRVDWVPVLKERKLVGTISRECILSAFGENHTS